MAEKYPFELVTGEKTYINHPSGRQIAQAVHVGGKLRTSMALKTKKEYEEITTIVLSARSDKELVAIASLLGTSGIRHEVFYDTNDHDYGKDVRVLTALASYPMYPSDTVGVLDYLPLWGE